MKKLTLSVLFASICLWVTASSAFAQNGTPSSKATAAISTAVGCTVGGTSNIGDTVPMTCHDIFSGAAVDVTPDNFATIMTTTVKVSTASRCSSHHRSLQGFTQIRRPKLPPVAPRRRLLWARSMRGRYSKTPMGMWFRSLMTNHQRAHLQLCFPECGHRHLHAGNSVILKLAKLFLSAYRNT